MSKESAKHFIEKIERDAHFRQQLQKVKGTSEAHKIVQANHFQFSKKEYEEAFREHYHRPLNESELKQIHAAGNSPFNIGGQTIRCNIGIEDE